MKFELENKGSKIGTSVSDMIALNFQSRLALRQEFGQFWVS